MSLLTLKYLCHGCFSYNINKSVMGSDPFTDPYKNVAEKNFITAWIRSLLSVSLIKVIRKKERMANNMDKALLKKALFQGIPIGLAFALVFILTRTFIEEVTFFDSMSSLYGILTLIFFPITFVGIIYNDLW